MPISRCALTATVGDPCHADLPVYTPDSSRTLPRITGLTQPYMIIILAGKTSMRNPAVRKGNAVTEARAGRWFSAGCRR
jgi:hypothetical protein